MSTSQNNARKKIFKKNNKNQENKKVSTGDPNAQQTSSTTYPNGVSVKTKKLKVEIKEKDEEKDQAQKVAELQEKTIQLEEKLNTLKSQYETEKNEDIRNINTINYELDKQTKDAKTVTNKNKNLITQLKNIEKDLNEKYTKVMNINFVKNKKEKTKNEKTIQKNINVKEKELENIKKITEATKTEEKKIEDLLNDVNNGLESNMKTELEELNKQINEITKEIEELYKNKSSHNNCIREINYLKSKLNLINNEIEFETKKKDMFMSVTINHRDNQIIKEYFIKSNDLSSNKNDYSRRIRDIILKKSNTKPPKVAKSAYKYIKTEFDSIQKNKKVGLKINSLNNKKKPTSVIDNVFVPETNLFTDRETEVLKKVLPEDYLNKYVEKYDAIKVEKDEIENKFGENDKIKNNNMYKKNELDIVKMRIKTKERVQTDLIIKIRQNKTKIVNLQKEISEYKKKINEQTNKLNRMNKYNKIYSEQIKNIKKK